MFSRRYLITIFVFLIVSYITTYQANISKITYGQSSDKQLHEIMRIGDKEDSLGLQKTVVWSDNDEYVFGGGNRSLWSYDLQQDKLSILLDDNDVNLTSLVLVEDDIIFSNSAGEIILFSTDNNLPIAQGLSDCFHTIALSPEKQQIAFIDTTESLKIINIVEPNENSSRFDLNSLYISSDICSTQISWSPDGNWLAMAGLGGGVYLLNLETEEVIYLIEQYSTIFDVSWSSDSKRIAFFYNTSLSVWNVPELDLNFEIDLTRERLGALAWSPDDHYLATSTRGISNHYIYIWDILTQERITTLEGHEGLITDLAWSHNGQYLASSAHDGTIIIWGYDE